MKKVLAMVLAAAMLLGMTSVAFATAALTLDPGRVTAVDDTKFYLVDDDGLVDLTQEGDTLPYGKVAYFPLLKDVTVDSGEPTLADRIVTDSDAVKSVSIKQDWDMGKTAIESVTIVKKKAVFAGGETKYGYFLAVKAKASENAKGTDVSGTITLKKSSGSFQFPDGEINVGLGFEIAFENVGQDTTIYDELKVHEFDDLEEESFTFDCEAGYFDVNVSGQKDLLLSVDTKFDSNIAALYPAANLNFVNGNGASFNRIGELTLYADPGSYLYSVGADGTLVPVQAEYDEYEEAFKIKTRTLGRYVISDTELKIVVSDNGSSSQGGSSSGSTGTVPPTTNNPQTGACV